LRNASQDVNLEKCFSRCQSLIEVPLVISYVPGSTWT